MVILPDIIVMLKILSSGKRGTRLRDITYMHPKGTSCGAPVVKFIVRRIPTKISHFWTDTINDGIAGKIAASLKVVQLVFQKNSVIITAMTWSLSKPICQKQKS